MNIHFDIDLTTSTLKGVLTLRAEDLYVEWRRYNLLDAPVGELESIALPFTELASISVRRKVLRPIIEIDAKAASTFGPMPLPAGNLTCLRARVSRSDRGKAEAWAAEAYLRIADAMISDDGVIDG